MVIFKTKTFMKSALQNLTFDNDMTVLLEVNIAIITVSEMAHV